MTPERWRRLEALFDQTADLPPDAQAAHLARAAPDDPALQADVLRLLTHDRSRGADVAAAIDGVARLPVPADPAALADPTLTGRRLGPWRLLREVGRGGMGVVYEAVRDDDAFHKRVAVKVAAYAAFAPELQQRFAHERQILAQLEHPRIARLLDGGTTDDGVPYLVMEFVEGQPIPAYAAAERLTVPQRLALFLQVCEAVEYAHQNLVVHRDLKPGNILAAGGEVKLLDFGIAKLVAATDAAVTQGGLGPATPDYCSPEQLRGDAVTTRTDVYALGLLLFELLVGRRAQHADTSSPAALERSICDAPLPLPSDAIGADDAALRRHLRGDLDAIVATATQKDPSRRYASAAALADDVRRHLDGRPIAARLDSASYRLGRFVRRYWLPLTAAAALVASLTAGVVATSYQARRAERRFAQVRGIANALMDDVHTAIRDLPSSSAAQDVVVRTAVEYLDGLAREAGDDPALQLEIARGYLKVARIAYALDRPSLSRLDDARRYYAQVQAVLDRFDADAVETNPDVAAVTLDLLTQRAQLLQETAQRAEMEQLLTRAVDLGEAALARAPAHPALLEAVGDALNAVTSQMTGSPLERRVIRRYVEVAEQVSRLAPDTPDSLAKLGTAYSQAGNFAAYNLDNAAARDLYRRAIDAQSRAVALAGDNATARRNLMIAWTNLADVALGPLGAGGYVGNGGPPVPIPDADRQEALDAFGRAVEQAEWLRERDPDNDTVQFDYAICLGRQAPAFPPGDPRAISQLEQSLAALEPLRSRYPGRTQAYLVELRGALAERLRQVGRLDAARAEWRAIDAMVRQDAAADPEGFYLRRLAIPITENWAMAEARAGRLAEARALAARAEELAAVMAAREERYARGPGWPPRVRAWHAEFHVLVGDAEAAATARAESLAMWKALAARDDLPPDLLAEARAAR
ncbi:MAG: protein kinase [Vicinamibacterales bacterium]